MTGHLATRWPGRCFVDGPVRITECQRMFAPVHAPQRDPEPGVQVDGTPLSVGELPLPHPSWGAQGGGGRGKGQWAGGLASPPQGPAGCSQGWAHGSVPRSQQGPPCGRGHGKRVLAGQVLAGTSTCFPTQRVSHSPALSSCMFIQSILHAVLLTPKLTSQLSVRDGFPGTSPDLRNS